MTTTVVEQLVELTGKDVTLTLTEGNTLEGKVEAASEAGIAFKEKGKGKLDLYTPDQITGVEAAPEKPKPVTQKKLKPIALGQARQHLLDRHGVTLAWAKDADEQAAFEYHQGLDHSDLGHKHEEKEAAGSEPTGDEAPSTEA